MPKANKKVKELLEDADDFYKKFKNKESLEKYEEVLKLDEDNIEANFRINILNAYETTYDNFNVEQLVIKLLEILPKCNDKDAYKYITETYFTVCDLKNFVIGLYNNNKFSKNDVDDLLNKIERCILAYKMIFNVAPNDMKNDISKMIIVTYDYLISKKYYYSGYDNKKVKLLYINTNKSRYKKERTESLDLLKENNYEEYKDLMMYYAINIRDKWKVVNYIILALSLIIMGFSFILCRKLVCLVFLIILYLITIPIVSSNLFKEKVKLEIIVKVLLFILGIISFIWFMVPLFAINKYYNGLDKSTISLNVKEGVEIIDNEKHTYNLNIKVLDNYYEFKLGNNKYRYRDKGNVYYLCRVKNDKCSTYFYDSNSSKNYISNAKEFKKYFQ